MKSKNLSRYYPLSSGKESKENVTIDFPKEGEVISSTHYAFNISTNTKAATVEVSIGGGNWLPCREALGRWWYDWNGYTLKKYALHARAILLDGRNFISPLRRFIVKPT